MLIGKTQAVPEQHRSRIELRMSPVVFKDVPQFQNCKIIKRTTRGRRKDQRERRSKNEKIYEYYYAV